MFIVKSGHDNSHAKVDDKNVIFDKANPPNEGDEVYFFYNKIKERGEVVMISNDVSVIDKTFYELTKKSRKLDVLSSSSGDDDDCDDVKTRTLPKKRPRKVNHKYSSESYENLDLFNLTKLNNDSSQDSLKKRKKTDLDEFESSNKNNSHKKSRKSDKDDLKKSYKKKADDLIQSSIEQSILDKTDKVPGKNRLVHRRMN
ncbi:uncharacterized protein LOC141537819 [Cotesia typhae]|uniref:uncharacterized protein LOC141537819 n=1 Tax=Cotesia typhae TaxID=2053667 RepID=UPI003D68C2F6